MKKSFFALISIFFSSICFAGVSDRETRQFAITRDNTTVTLSYRFRFNGGNFEACDIDATVYNPSVDEQGLATRATIYVTNVYGEHSSLSTEPSREIAPNTVEAKFDGCVPMVADRFGNVIFNQQHLVVLLDESVRVSEDMKMAW